MRGKNKIIYNHVGTKHTDHVIDVIFVPEGGITKIRYMGLGNLENLMKLGLDITVKNPPKQLTQDIEITFIISGIEFRL